VSESVGSSLLYEVVYYAYVCPGERILAEKDLAAVATWVASENQIAGSGVGSKGSSVVGPKLPANYDRSKLTVSGVDSSSSTGNATRTADIGFDDDSD
jgi:hypothetical protein